MKTAKIWQHYDELFFDAKFHHFDALQFKRAEITNVNIIFSL